MEITYTTGDCRFGRLLVASSAKGLCMVSMAKSDAELERKLHDQFPADSARRDDRGMRQTLGAVKGRIAGKGLSERMPLDLQGTEFQLEVWKEMLRIPPGSTRSYGEVAKRIGRPKAFRAVAQACGANPVPVVVPCHRVVASGGALGGYTGGLDRKLVLLEGEGVTNPKWKAS
jgi:AraC family transcriptional regulator of adaptative response/methylated-DNA-[protein]-cysteine methyltransferase